MFLFSHSKQSLSPDISNERLLVLSTESLVTSLVTKIIVAFAELMSNYSVGP